MDAIIRASEKIQAVIDKACLLMFMTDVLYKSRSCLGGCAKPTHTPVDDYPPKGLRCQGQVLEKQSLSDDFWGTSTGDLDNPIGLSQRRISSLSTSNVSFLSDIGSASMNGYNDFVNPIHLQWIGASKSNEDHQAIGPEISSNYTQQAQGSNIAQN